MGAVLGLLGPGPLEDNNLAGLATMIMISAVLVAAIFLYSGGRVVRWQAVALLGLYLAAMPLTISTTIDCAEEPTVETVEECSESRPVALAGG